MACYYASAAGTIGGMTKKKTSKKQSLPQTQELDGVFFFKLVLYLILGSLWLKTTNSGSVELGIPIGFIVGLAFAMHEHFQIDRKIEFAVLLIATLIGFIAPFGLYIAF